MQTPPMTQEMIAAGPAAIRPSWAPNSQPEPMIEPIEAHIRPIRPISRFSAKLRRLPPGWTRSSVDGHTAEPSRRGSPEPARRQRPSGYVPPMRSSPETSDRRRRATRNGRQQGLAERADRDGVQDRAEARRRHRAAGRSRRRSAPSGCAPAAATGRYAAPARSSARRAGRGRTAHRCTPRWPRPAAAMPADERGRPARPIASGVGEHGQEERRWRGRSRSRSRSCRARASRAAGSRPASPRS